jgi:hypothetical protein
VDWHRDNRSNNTQIIIERENKRELNVYAQNTMTRMLPQRDILGRRELWRI